MAIADLSDTTVIGLGLLVLIGPIVFAAVVIEWRSAKVRHQYARHYREEALRSDEI